jgi:hypothetical protein
MALAQSAAPGLDLIVLAFFGGIALATLIFWPLLHRAQQQLAVAERSGYSPRGGKPARPKPSTTQPISTASRTATKATIVMPRTDSAHEVNPTSATLLDPGTAPTSASADDESVGTDWSKISIEEQLEVSTQPTDLYEQHYEAKFERTRKRLARLKQQLNEQMKEQ